MIIGMEKSGKPWKLYCWPGKGRCELHCWLPLHLLLLIFFQFMTQSI